MEIVRPGFHRVDARGTLTEVLNAGTWKSVLHGRMHAGAVLGNHFHKVTDVFVYLVAGCASVVQMDLGSGTERRGALAAGEGVWLRINVAHAIRFEEDSSIIVLKSQHYNDDDSDTFPHHVAF